MSTRNVNSTDEVEGPIQAKVESGGFQNARENASTALRTFEHHEREFETKLAALRNAIDQGDANGVLEYNPFERVREAIRLAKNMDEIDL